MNGNLHQIMEWYETAKVSIRASRSLVKWDEIPNDARYRPVQGGSPGERQQKLETADRELDALVVLALVAAFERHVRTTVEQIVRERFQTPRGAEVEIKGELLKEIEYWSLRTKLVDMFAHIEEGVRGNVKQLIQYRDWVAHARFDSDPPIHAEPHMAYARLEEFLIKLRETPTN